MNFTENPREFNIMKDGGSKLGLILAQLLKISKPGTRLLDIEKLAEKLIRFSGGTPSFKTVRGYKWVTCLCVNDQVVHGVPRGYILKDGDILTVDIGLNYKGLHTDTAWTKIIGGDKSPDFFKKKKFLRTGKSALAKAISEARIGNNIGHISRAIQGVIEGAGYSVVKSLVGHGIGRRLHEEPQIPGFLSGPVEETEALKIGMFLAIEVIYALNKSDIETSTHDGWTMYTKDHSLSAVFEHTIAVNKGRPFVCTKRSEA